MDLDIERAAEVLFKANDPEGFSAWLDAGKPPINPRWREQVELVLQAVSDQSC